MIDTGRIRHDVLGFLFDTESPRVLLVREPCGAGAEQLVGIHGSIEDGEEPGSAMRRVFLHAVHVELDSAPFCIAGGPRYRWHCFAARHDLNACRLFFHARRWEIADVDCLPSAAATWTRWLVALALDPSARGLIAYHVETATLVEQALGAC